MLVETIPVDSFPVSTEIVLNMLRVKTNQYGCEWISINVPGTHTKYDFDTYIWTLPMWKQQLLMHWVPFLSTTDQILFASDGSFDQEEKKGSFGAVFGDNDQLYATISGAARGCPELHCAFRSEMYRLLASCSLFNEITTFYDINGHDQDIWLVFYLDSQSTIDRVQKHQSSPIPCFEWYAGSQHGH